MVQKRTRNGAETDGPPPTRAAWPGWLALALVGYLALRALDQLRVEWTLNAQYAYGWAVPFLCAWLCWRRGTEGRRQRAVVRDQKAKVRGQGSEVGGAGGKMESGKQKAEISGSQLSTLNSQLPIFILLLAFLGTRLIAEANPDWRLVSWALALEAVAGALWFVHGRGGRAAVRQYAFPILFFLVAVPWPSFVEQPVIQLLTRGIVAVTAELMQAFGLVAVIHGNVIETARGWVDVDEACSGIRSLQAALMLALFFGEWQRLNGPRRAALGGAAFALACVFNLARTLTLSLVAAQQGTAAVARWHDPAGTAIVLGCFYGVWAAAEWMEKRQRAEGRRRRAEVRNQKSEVTDAPASNPQSSMAVPSSGSQLSTFNFQPTSPFRGLIFAVLILLAGEIAIFFWYASAPRVSTADWAAVLPRERTGYKPVELPRAAAEILRFNEGESGAWLNEDGTRWQMIALRWFPGRAAVALARNHTPEICLPAAGKKLSAMSGPLPLTAAGVTLPFRCFTTEQNGRPLVVFYTLWEEGAPAQNVATGFLTWSARWQAVRERRRNPGQRVIQIAVAGAREAAHAEELLRAELPRLIQAK